MSDDATLLEAVCVGCIRGGRELFSAFSCRVTNGDVLFVEGANGAGKTSLLRILAGLLEPTDGEVRWAGHSIRHTRSEYNRALTYIGHAAGVNDNLTVCENMRVWSGVGAPRSGVNVDEALAQFGLADYGDAPAGCLSAGQRRRIALARLLVEDSRVWLLDEPFAALDADGRATVERLLDWHVKAGGTAVVTTHQPMSLAGCNIQCVRLGQ